MDAKTLFIQGVKLHQAGNLPAAIVLYQEAIAIENTNGDIALYLALALQQTGRLSEAEQAYVHAHNLSPSDADILNGLGSVCLELGKLPEARLAHTKALALNKVSPEAHGGLGNIELAEGRYDAAIKHLQISLSIQPDSPDSLNNLGIALKLAGRTKEAVQAFEKSLDLMPDSAETLYNLGNAWQARGDMSKALACYRKALACDPTAVAPRWGACFAQLDTCYDSQTAISFSRIRYQTALHDLDSFITLDTPEQIRDAASVVGANQPFYLTYQGLNDRDLQTQYGQLVHRIMATAYPQFSTARHPSSHKRIRVGLATGFLHEHSVWKIPTRGWAKHLDRSKFEVYGYYTGVKSDHCTDEARQLFDKLTHIPHNFETLCQAIVDDELDALIFPDIGMDPTCAKLGGLRLAPIQCVSLGHPMTTGLPTIDYYLSSELMEPEDGDLAYTEDLVRLPNLSVYYEPLMTGKPSYSRQDFGLSEDELIYFCPQSLYKYLPQHDKLFPLIAQKVPNCRFVFLENGHADALNSRFMARLTRSFTDHGMDRRDYVTMLPHQPADRYYALNCLSDIFLDSIEWSGFNTAMEAVNTGLPIVIYPKGHMRGRHSLAAATMLGLEEIISNSFEDYLSIAIELGNNSDFRHQIRKKTEANRSRLFGDMQAIKGLELFIEQAVQKLQA